MTETSRTASYSGYDSCASVADVERPKVVIRWCRYGKNGGRWRADLPPGNGIDSGFVESSSLDTVERVAADVAERYGYEMVREVEIRVDA
jgi:hypothetical protein